MTQEKKTIIICRATRRYMSWGLLWPSQDEEFNRGRRFFLSILLYSIISAIQAVLLSMHMMTRFKSQGNVTAGEDMSLLTAFIATSYVTFCYVRNQHKIAVLLRDSVNFYNFGEPPGFKKLVKVLDFLSHAAAAYCILGMAVYNAVRLYQKSECQKQNCVESLRQGCGLVTPVWIPFKIDYFPIYELVFCYEFLSCLLIIKSSMFIPFHALEIAQYVILKIKHLNSMIVECFDEEDYEKCRKNLRKCILYHVEIIDLATRLDGCFSSSMFSHLLITAVVCALIEKQLFDGDVLCAGLHLFGWLLNLFISCVAGQLITNASESIPEAIWKSKWYQADPRLQTDVLFFLHRCQKNVYFSAGSFGVLSFDLYVSVLKMSYSVLCLLTS